jgi:hypothetical protein
MQNTFILRYLEDCTASMPSGAESGTMTKTAVPREGDDKDAPMAFSGVFGSPSLELGTATATRVQGEHGDTDAQGRGLKGSKAWGHMASQTHTLIAAEAPDKGRSIISLFGNS